uniref:Uncharacterized protein n=1 Tax=viral metagenome TaxID=1070528 RepID=A0A6C0F720_9ZZZZ
MDPRLAIHNPTDDKGMFHMYQNSGYTRETKKRSLVVAFDIEDTTTFDVSVSEPLIIDFPSYAYLDSLTTFNADENGSLDKMAFVIKMDDFNHQNSGNSISSVDTNRSLVIPNEADATGKTRVHKGRKMNYISYEPPQKITQLKGTITFLNGNSINPSRETCRVIMEILFVEK